MKVFSFSSDGGECLISIEVRKGNPLIFLDGTQEDLWIASHEKSLKAHPNGVHGRTPYEAALNCFNAIRIQL